MSRVPYSLNVIDVPVPCTAPWEDMHGDEVKRYCDHCQLNVYNLSAMSRADAEAFLASGGEHVCVRFYRRADGTVATGDCENAWLRRARATAQASRRLVGAAVSALAAMLAIGTGWNSRAVGEPGAKDAQVKPSRQAMEVVMGAPMPPPPATQGAPQPLIMVQGEVNAPTPATTRPAGQHAPAMMGKIAPPTTLPTTQPTTQASNDTATTQPRRPFVLGRIGMRPRGG